MIEAVPPDDFKDFVLRLRCAASRRQRHHSAQGARAGAVEAGRARARGRRRQYAVVRDGELCSTNTDVKALSKSRRLRARMGQGDRCAGARRRRLGAGRGVRPDRGRHQAAVHLANQGRQRAKTLGGSGRRRALIPFAWDAIAELLKRAGLMVNTTSSACTASLRWNSISAGYRRMPRSPISFTCRWKRHCWPPRSARGLRTADGLGMLLHQAVRGFELWFAHRPLVTSELRAMVEADLNHA